jgi:hypothetical protein
VSHRVHRELNGALHEESLYSRRDGDEKGWIRYPVARLEEKHLSDLRDPILCERLRHWIAAGRPEPGPVIHCRGGVLRVVRHVRIRASRGGLVPIGEGHRRRYVAPGSNHHMEVFRSSGSGREFLTRLVTRLQAMDRHRKRLPVVDRRWGEEDPEAIFLFSLYPGDCIGRPYGPGWDVIRVTSVTERLWEGVGVLDARPATDIRKAGAQGGRIQKSPHALLRDGFVKVDVSATGRVSRSHE